MPVPSIAAERRLRRSPSLLILLALALPVVGAASWPHPAAAGPAATSAERDDGGSDDHGGDDHGGDDRGGDDGGRGSGSGSGSSGASVGGGNDAADWRRDTVGSIRPVDGILVVRGPNGAIGRVLADEVDIEYPDGFRESLRGSRLTLFDPDGLVVTDREVIPEDRRRLEWVAR